MQDPKGFEQCQGTFSPPVLQLLLSLCHSSDVEGRRAAGIQLPLESREIWDQLSVEKSSVQSEGAELEGVLESASKDKNQALKEQGEGEARLGHEK